MKLILADKSAREPQNSAATRERLVNLYPVPAPEGGKASFVLRAAPGTRDFVTLPTPFIRAGAEIEGQLYVVALGNLYRIPETGSPLVIATVADDPNTAIVGHRANVTIAAGTNYYLWDGTSLTQPGSGALTDVNSVAFLDQYTLLGEYGGRRVEWTAVGEPNTRNGLYFRTAEGRDDKIVRLVESGAYVWIFKQKSTEIWTSQPGGPRSAFIRIPGAVIDTGLLAFNLVCKTPRGLFGVGHDKVAYFWAGAEPEPLSTPAVDQALEEGEPTHCFYYEDRGHRFCCIRFHDRPAWVLDISMGKWHERSSGVRHSEWDVIGSAYAYGRWHMFSKLGRVYRLGLQPFDATGPMRRTVISRPLYMDGDNFSVNELELLGQFGRYEQTEIAPNWMQDEYGIPIADEDGHYIIAEDDDGSAGTIQRPGRVWLRTSSDGGNTWDLPRTRDIGTVGQFSRKCIWHGLGDFEVFTAEFNMTDPVDFPILSEANVT